MRAILAAVAEAALTGCRVVMNLAMLESLHEAMAIMQTLDWSPQVTQVNIAHGKAIAGKTRLAPLNPVFIVSGVVH